MMCLSPNSEGKSCVLGQIYSGDRVDLSAWFIETINILEAMGADAQSRFVMCADSCIPAWTEEINRRKGVNGA
jgi:hypothetical protein